jgi:hypothetical protein
MDLGKQSDSGASSGLRRMGRHWRVATALLVMMAIWAAQGVAADKKKRGPTTVSYTPMPLDSGFGPMDLSEPAIAPEEIIKKFTEKESEFRAALNRYTYRRTVKTQTITDDGKVDGEYYEVDDVIFDPEGKRTEKVVYAPATTLTRISMSPADFQDIQQRLPFVLTTDALSIYDVKYVGRQKVDDVMCYVFDVAPKVMEKGKRYLQGKFWVDAEDLQIVVTSAKNVPDDTRPGHEDLSTPFTTYRQQIDGKYWFPTYTKADGILHFAGGHGYLSEDVHVRTTVKYSDYKQYGSTSTILYEGQVVPNAADDTSGGKPAESKPEPPK